MSKEQWLSIIRHTLSAIAGILVAKGVLESGIATEILGAVLGLTSTVWSFFDKTATFERVKAVVRQVLTVLGSYWTVFSPELTEQILFALSTLVPVLLGQTNKLKDAVPAEETTA